MEALILIGLIVLNGLFAMSEIALLTARKGRLMGMAADGDAAAAAALRLGEEPTRFLSTIQIGITSIGILNGIIGEAVLAQPLALWLQSLGASTDASEIGATALVVIVVTYISIVVGELVPKRLGQINPETIARLVARPMQALAAGARPFVRLLSVSTDALVRLFGVRHTSNADILEEEIHALLQEGSESGAIEEQQHAMLRNVFRLDDRKLGSLMIPRADITYLDTTLPLQENLKLIADHPHSRFPVCQGGLGNLLGVINTKRILTALLHDQMPNLTDNLQPCLYVPATLTGMELLENFRNNNVYMAFAVDEYGEVEGIVTLKDLLESVTGEFTALNIDEGWAVQREDGSWLLDGIIPLPELKDRLFIRQLPEEDKGNYHTLSGMLMLLLERLPRTGDYIDWENWRFEVVDMDGRRIDKVLATRRTPPSVPLDE